MVIKDKQVGNYKLFDGQEDIERILQNICYCLNDMDAHLSRVEGYVVPDSASRNLPNPPRGTTLPLVDDRPNLTVISY